MNAYVFPGQGAQFPGMGATLFESSTLAKERFNQANAILGFPITEIMFGDDAEALKETRVTQPAIFLHATILSEVMGDRFAPDMVAGHSLGEFSALVAAGVLSFEDGLGLVKERALAMQAACDHVPGTMAAILGLEDAERLGLRQRQWQRLGRRRRRRQGQRLGRRQGQRRRQRLGLRQRQRRQQRQWRRLGQRLNKCDHTRTRSTTQRDKHNSHERPKHAQAWNDFADRTSFESWRQGCRRSTCSTRANSITRAGGLRAATGWR